MNNRINIISLPFDRAFLDAMQTSDKFECLFSAQSANGVAEIYSIEGTQDAFFLRFNGNNGESSEAGFEIVTDVDYAQNWAREQIAHLSYNYECEGEFESLDDMPDPVLDDFRVAVAEEGFTAD